LQCSKFNRIKTQFGSLERAAEFVIARVDWLGSSLRQTTSVRLRHAAAQKIRLPGCRACRSGRFESSPTASAFGLNALIDHVSFDAVDWMITTRVD
jgi:hypothetical protein